MNRWWQPRTLRFRLALWYAVSGAILLAIYSAGLFFFVARRLPVEYRLRQDLAMIRAHLTVLPDGSIDWNGGPIGPPESWSADNPWFELWNEQGLLVVRRWPFADRPREYQPYAPVPGREVFSIFRIASDVRVRVLSLPFPGPLGKDWMLRIMRVHEPTGDALAALRLVLSLMLPVVVALLVAGGYTLTRYWLKPFNQMAAEAEQIGADSLSRRLTVPGSSDEIGRLATIFNATLDRLEDAFVTLDRFVADASHELRTPLTALRNVGELGLARSRSTDEYRDIIGSMLEETQRLQLLIQRLLELARVEGGAEQARREPVRLDKEVASCLDEFSILAEMRQQRLVFSGEPCEVETDPVIFRQVLQNLVDNAIKFSPEGTTITVTIARSATQSSVSVADEGPGIAPEDQTHITRRFFRADDSRGRAEGGFGLGLAVTKAYMRMLGGRLDYEPRLPRGSVFRVSLPVQAVGGKIP